MNILSTNWSIDMIAKSTSLCSVIVVRSQILIRFKEEKDRSHDAELTATVSMICNSLTKFENAF